VRFWLSLNFEPWEQLLDLARLAEEVGFEGVVLPDHIVIPSGELTPHPSGYPLKPDEPFVEPLIAFATMAGATTRLKFLSGVIVVPQRDPYLLAKQLGTLALLSGDRVILGTGAGWLPEEFDILGQPFGDRGRRIDEMLELMADFWADGWAEQHGGHFELPRSAMFPPPVNQVPIWVGGNSPAGIRRAARFDGYIPMRLFDDQARAEFVEVDRLRAEQGRTGPYERVAFWSEGDRSTAAEMAERDGIGSAVAAVWPYYSDLSLRDKQVAAEAFAKEIFA
jgi:probable F420-dependent oxidoreductase